MGSRLVSLPGLLLLASAVLAAGFDRPDGRTSVRDGRVNIHANAEPLADVLSRFAQAIGAELVFETARPRQLVTVGIDARSEAEALARLLEGQGLNYALRLGPDGRRVQMLVISGTAAAVPARDVVPAQGRTPPPASFAPVDEEPEDEALPEQDQGSPPEDSVPGGSTAAPPPFASPGFLPGNPTTPGVESGPATSPNVPPGSPPFVQPPQAPFPASYPPRFPPAFPGPASYPRPGD